MFNLSPPMHKANLTHFRPQQQQNLFLLLQLKISACGHELGSDILFGRRIGFSGTPSNLLPSDLGECQYEPGSDGRILKVRQGA
jgi:hypothetical protein